MSVFGADSSTEQTVNIYELLENDETYNKIWRTVTAGYPYRTPEELGVSDWRSAYQATKYAIYCVIRTSQR